MSPKKIIIVSLILVVVSVAAFFVRNKAYDNQISQLESICDYKEQVIADMAADVYKSDAQYQADMNHMNKVFSDIFTFYNIDDFNACIKLAEQYDLPQSFISNFYNKNELAGLYAEAMLDIICKFESADYFLLERTEDAGYYFADVCLNTVKYSSGSFRLGFFVTLQNDGSISSMIYYNLE